MPLCARSGNFAVQTIYRKFKEGLMHELSVTEGILNTALDEARKLGVSRIIRIKLAVGELSGIVPECVQEYFDILSEDTAACGARLDFTVLPAMLCCRECGSKFRMEHMRLRCPVCMSGKADIIQGKEFYLEAMEVESETE